MDRKSREDNRSRGYEKYRDDTGRKYMHADADSAGDTRHLSGAGSGSGSGRVNPRDLLYSHAMDDQYDYDHRNPAPGGGAGSSHEAALLRQGREDDLYRNSAGDAGDWNRGMDASTDYLYPRDKSANGHTRIAKAKVSPTHGRKPSMTNTDHDENDDHYHHTDDSAPAGSGNKSTTGKRAAQACLRCRRQKLRCLGGWPCNRCKKSNNTCDFGKPAVAGFINQSAGVGASGEPGLSGGGSKDPTAAEANARLQQLESSVATLLAGLAGSGATDIPTLKELLGGEREPRSQAAPSFTTTGKFSSATTTTAGGTGAGGDLAPRAYSFSSNASDPRPFLPAPITATSLQPWQTIPPPLHAGSMDPPRPLDTLPSLTPEAQAGAGHVRFSSSPHITFTTQPLTSPSNHDSSGISPASGPSTTGGSERREKRLGKGQKAEERLAAATDGEYEAPFKALVYQPAVWDNKEQSRRSSPQPSGDTMSRDEISGNPYDRRFGREKDDPVNTGLVDIDMAQTLFNFFVDHCHPFLPIVNVALSDPFQTIRQSPFLISAILAIAARFFIRHSMRSLAAVPYIDPSLPARLANLAETHLSQTLLRKSHALSDVQAILLMSAWGLQAGGKGPDAWIITGHAARVARRLGVHKILARATEQARKASPGTEEWTKLEAFMPQWRTWLTWFCFDGFLSLGFGRPQSTQFETVDEQGFLQLRLAQPLPRPGSTSSVSLYGDVYTAGQVQLTQIGRDLVNWGEMLADPDKAALDESGRRADMLLKEGGKLDVRTMFRELNGRLDEWSKLWVWSGSQYSLYLGSSARIARLQAEHMRLCLNSYALKARPDEDELVAQCLRKALNAAMSTIQTHFESSQTDQALSFATDYLTITLAQAAVFLIRITKSPASVQAVVNLDPSVVAHYLTMAVTLLETADLSETRLSTYLAKTIREISRAAGITGLTPSTSVAGPEGEEDGAEGKGFAAGQGVFMGDLGGNGPGQSGAGYQTQLSVSGTGLYPSSSGGPLMNWTGLGIGPGSGSGSGAGTSTANANTNANANPTYRPTAEEPFDLESFLQLESQVDLGYLLGLPGDAGAGGASMGFGTGGDETPTVPSGSGLGWGGWDQGGIGEFEFGGGISGAGSMLGWMDLGLGAGGGAGQGSGTGAGQGT